LAPLSSGAFGRVRLTEVGYAALPFLQQSRIAVCTARIMRHVNTPVNRPCENSRRGDTIPDRAAMRAVAHLSTA